MSSQIAAQPPVLPRDARLIALLLVASGASDAEEGVVRMLVEFAHRYTTDILSDALLYGEHARTGQTHSSAAVIPSLDDVRLAVQARTEGARIPKELLLQLANSINAVPLPAVPEVYGIRLPPAASRLTAPNFSLVPRSTTSSAAAAVPTTLANGEGSIGTSSERGDEDEEEEEEDETEDDDEEMEDVTAGIGGGGEAAGSRPSMNSTESSSSSKRKSDELAG